MDAAAAREPIALEEFHSPRHFRMWDYFVSPTGRFYERIAVAHDSAECHCSGRAFRRLAELAWQPAQQLVRGLPPHAWNYEP